MHSVLKGMHKQILHTLCMWLTDVYPGVAMPAKVHGVYSHMCGHDSKVLNILWLYCILSSTLVGCSVAACGKPFMQLVKTNPESVLVTWMNRFFGVDVGVCCRYTPFLPQLKNAKI